MVGMVGQQAQEVEGQQAQEAEGQQDEQAKIADVEVAWANFFLKINQYYNIYISNRKNLQSEQQGYQVKKEEQVHPEEAI